MKVPARRRGNLPVGAEDPRPGRASMKVPARRRGNAADMINPLYTLCLNESPRPKAGKLESG